MESSDFWSPWTPNPGPPFYFDPTADNWNVTVTFTLIYNSITLLFSLFSYPLSLHFRVLQHFKDISIRDFCIFVQCSHLFWIVSFFLKWLFRSNKFKWYLFYEICWVLFCQYCFISYRALSCTTSKTPLKDYVVLHSPYWLTYVVLHTFKRLCCSALTVLLKLCCSALSWN